MAEKFPGFQSPEQNWSRLPHQLIEAFPHFSTKGELMVVLYILRHTWGFQEYDQLKKITIDEFMHGRKTKKGRMDGGVGMSKGAVVRGLQRAEEDGFIKTEKDDRDKARIKKYYTLRMAGEDILDVVSQNETPKPSGVSKEDLDVPKQDIGVTKQDSDGSKTVHRSEKETLERNSQKETEVKETDLFPEKPLDSGLDKYWEHCQQTEAIKKAGGDYASPPQAGGGDAAAEAALEAIYRALGSEPPARDTSSWIKAIEVVSQVLRDHRITEPAVAAHAGKLMGEANREAPQFANPHLASFPSSFSLFVGKAKKRARDSEARQVETEALWEEKYPTSQPAAEQTIWDHAKTELGLQMSKATFETYVKPTRLVNHENGVLTIGVPDIIIKDWLESRLLSTIQRLLVGIVGQPVKVKFEVST